MKISVEFLREVFALFRCFPEDKQNQFIDCLQEVEDGKMKYGTIELSISPGPDGKPVISRVKQVKQFER